MSDGESSIFLRITLESNDIEQSLFAKEHPKEAAAGLRKFSLDAYRETGLTANGQRTQTHYSFKFFVGQPPYGAIREEFIKVAKRHEYAHQQPLKSDRPLGTKLKVFDHWLTR